MCRLLRCEVHFPRLPEKRYKVVYLALLLFSGISLDLLELDSPVHLPQDVVILKDLRSISPQAVEIVPWHSHRTCLDPRPGFELYERLVLSWSIASYRHGCATLILAIWLRPWTPPNSYLY
jgi:hypothetical protein